MPFGLTEKDKHLSFQYGPMILPMTNDYTFNMTYLEEHRHKLHRHKLTRFRKRKKLQAAMLKYVKLLRRIRLLGSTGIFSISAKLKVIFRALVTWGVISIQIRVIV